MNMPPSSELSPQQAADVIRFRHNAANKEAREHGWRDKVSMGHAAVQAQLPRHSMLPDEQPMLTPQEASAGLKHIDMPQITAWPVEPTADEWARIEKLNDTMPLATAYTAVMGILPTQQR
ncbi:MAG: hypothetical protein ACM3KF_01515 [Acidobacteriota bacterium]